MGRARDVNKVVALLTTGGTVSTTTDPRGRTAPTLGTAELAALISMPGITLRPRELSKAPSWTLDPATMAHIAVAARDAARDPTIDGVVLSHGTSTLEYSAFLCDLVLDVPTPVVLTGAMRRSDEEGADGPRNLADAVAVASSDRARGLGALVVFGGHIIAARRAWKAHRVDRTAFIALDGDVGRVAAGRVEIDRPTARGPIFSGALDTLVGFVKVVPGAGGGAIEIAAGSYPHGLVVEGLPGAGGIPPGMLDAVRLAAARMPVVIASRAPFGRLPQVPTGGTGEPLRDAVLLSAGDLTAEQAWLLLMATLGDGGTRDEVSRRFTDAANVDDPSPESEVTGE